MKLEGLWEAKALSLLDLLEVHGDIGEVLCFEEALLVSLEHAEDIAKKHPPGGEGCE